MDLFKRKSLTDIPRQERQIYVAITNPDGDDTTVEQPWCNFRAIASFLDLVKGQEEAEVPLIILIPDEKFRLDQIKLVCDNSGLTEVSVVWVKGVTKHSPSQQAEASFWNHRFVDFEDWRLEAEEATRLTELASRAALSPDEQKLALITRKSGHVKPFDHATLVKGGVAEAITTKLVVETEVDDTPELSF